MELSRQTLDISWGAILKVCLAFFIFYIGYLVRDAIIWFSFGLIISVLLEPMINFLRLLRIPKIVAVIVTYLLIFGFLSLIIYLTAPILIVEIKQFSQSIPQYFDKISPVLKGLGLTAFKDVESLMNTIAGNLEAVSMNIINALAGFFGGIVSAIFILSIAFFISLEENGVEKFLRLLAPKKYEETALAIFGKCQKKISSWFGSRILACLFVSLVSYIVFFFFGVKYAFVLAFLAGVLNFVPYLGPLFTGVLLIITVGVSDSWMKAMIVLLAYVVINGIENNVVSPILTKKFIGLPAVFVLLSLVIGGEVFGFLGAIFAVPVFGIVYEFTREFLERKKEMEY